MRAAVTTEQHGFDVIEITDPTPGPDELVIRVVACGVCGSDIKAQPFMPAGMVMGHEFGGEIVAVGSNADGWREGTNVAVMPVVSCGSCQYCTAGFVSHCAQARYIGMGPDGGGFAEFAVVPARHAFALPDEMTNTYAALVEPFAVGLHGVHGAQLSPGEDVLVVGAGGVGLTTIAWARAKGARRITAVDPDPNGASRPLSWVQAMRKPRLRTPTLMTWHWNVLGVRNFYRHARRPCARKGASSSPVRPPSQPPSNP
ncbi:MAG TPA: alcohol dehydrogenase catalytic domain-containing protein [Mycobacterium sp.]|nr:alcohol dehydrogenase catalytic domain-containing protein [Mycobacterium sp.]